MTSSSGCSAPPRRCRAFKATRVNPIEVEDCAVASLLMADGSLVSLSATLGSARQAVRMRFCFENVAFEKLGLDDDFKPGDEPWTMIPRTPEIGRAIVAKMQEVAPQKAWFARQYELFHEAIASGAPFPVTLADARASLELITACYRASETGRSVALPIGPGDSRYGGWAPGQSGRNVPTPADGQPNVNGPGLRTSGERRMLLDRMKVVSFCHVLQGPACTQYLGDMGAQVIKVEPLGGERSRRWAGAEMPGGVSGLYLCAFRNKRLFSVDLKSPEGREIVLSLIEKADVVVENFRAGVMDRLGLGYEDAQEAQAGHHLRERHRLGQQGPDARRASRRTSSSRRGPA